jgi:hypothetical protein
MRTFATVPKLLSQAMLVMLIPAMVGSAYAGSLPSGSGTAVVSGQATTSTRGLSSNAAAVHPAASIKIITAPTPIAIVPSGPLNPPGLYNLQATASSVTVKWYDRSNNELGFKVFRRDLSGNWQMVDQIGSRDVSGSGNQSGDYSGVDTGTDLSGQCYKIAAYNTVNIGYTAEECTVRPDPSRFPQTVAVTVPSWTGLSAVNDGTGILANVGIGSLGNLGPGQYLQYGERTWGVNLTWGNSSLWKVEAQGGPHLMKGQAVALKVWGGGWLKYGDQTFGVNLQLSATPVYEWYVIGLENDSSKRTWAGADLTNGGTFALWNSTAKSYLVPGYQTFGVGLNWYDGSSPSPNPTPTPTHGVKTEQVLNCSVDQHAVEVFIADQTTGSGFVDKGTVNEQYGSSGCPAPGSVPLTFSPLSGHQYLLVATDKSLSSCDGVDDPQESGCRKMTAQFVGDTNGVTRTDIVDIGTQITP